MPDPYEINKDMKILVADDDASIRELLITLLKSLGLANMDMADNGKNAYKSIISNDYDAIFMDIEMPGLSGVEVVQKIRSDKPQARVILITGMYHEGEILEVAKDIKAFGTIKKPFSIASIKNILMDISYEITLSCNQ